MVCNYMMVLFGIAAISIIATSIRLYKYRMMLDIQYRAMVADIERQQKELNKDLSWVDRRCRELDSREDRIRQKEKELNFLP